MNQPFHPGPPQQYPQQGFPAQQQGFPGQQPGLPGQQPGFQPSFAPRPAVGGAKGFAIAGFLCALPVTLYSFVSNVYWLIAHDNLLLPGITMPIAQVVFGIAALALGGIGLAKARRSPAPFTPAALGGIATF